MTVGKKLAASAVMGILSAAITYGGGGQDAQAAVDPAVNAVNEGPNGWGRKGGCGSKDGGSCRAMNLPSADGPWAIPK
ncbi:hypothetical protein [Pendulispora albinea]|uniref:Uncharacterized protein n=1 Tax=Pendulispora albinea TaxID=2741071 RepID=A0ABZ2MA74_9BACT